MEDLCYQFPVRVKIQKKTGKIYEIEKGIINQNGFPWECDLREPHFV